MNQLEHHNKRLAELQQVVNALDWARKQDLDLEWLDTYDEHRLQGYTVTDAIKHANREWDL